MRFASLEHFEVDIRKIVLVGSAAAASVVIVGGVIMGDVLGAAGVPTLAVVGLLVFYIVLSSPRRLRDRERVGEARESVFVSAAASACLNVTGSRTRTAVYLRSREASLIAALNSVGRQLLLGVPIEDATASASQRLSSYSAAASLRSLATLSPGTFDPGDEETRGLATSAEMSRETKVPVFTTACFFTPILLLMYAVFSHRFDPQSLAELTAFEFLLLDLAFYFTSTDGGAR